MKTIAAQYLESVPSGTTPAKVRQRLREAFELLPLSIVILGWDLPQRFEDAVAEETTRHGATLYRWHPLLASDAGFALPVEWQPVNLHDEPVPGFKGMPEFTFMCPNRTDVQEWIAERIEGAAQRATDAMIAARAKARGVSEADYMSGNLLHAEVTADDVAQALDALAKARKTTGHIGTVDGGNIAAALR